MSYIAATAENFGATGPSNGSWIQALYEATVGGIGGGATGATGPAGTSGTSGVSGTSGTSGGGGGGGLVLPNIQNGDYGLAWTFYQPSPSGPFAGFAYRPVFINAYVPAGTYNRFRTWVHTAAAGDIYMGLYESDYTKRLSNIYQPTNLLASSGPIPATAGEKIVNLAAPITLSAGVYAFATMYINPANTSWEGRYAGFTNLQAEHYRMSSFGKFWEDGFAVLGNVSSNTNLTATFSSFPNPAPVGTGAYGSTSLGFGFSLMAQ